MNAHELHSWQLRPRLKGMSMPQCSFAMQCMDPYHWKLNHAVKPTFVNYNVCDPI